MSRPKAPLELVEREIPSPGPGTVRIKVEACGVCHSDMFTVEGLFPGIEFPRVPGHEVIGTVDAVGAGVSDFKPGQRVGIGWNGGYDGRCDACRRGTGVRSMNEYFPLERAADAYKHMMSGKARFRAVLKMS